MRTIETTRKSLDLKEYVKRSAQESDYETLVRDDCLIKIDGKPAIFYMRLDKATVDMEPLRRALLGIRYDTTTRSSGLKTTSRVFGYQPRIPMRRDFCTATSLATEQPNTNQLVEDYGRAIASIYQRAFPEVFEHHDEWTREKIKEEWQIKKTPFTSGIINKNNPLKYHFDAGNIPSVCSCMLALKQSCGGGYLSFPELNLALEIGDKTLSIFDGQSVLHGVTPIRKLSENAHRFTVVFYTLLQMWKCEPLTEEIARIRKVKTEREHRRIQLKKELSLSASEGTTTEPNEAELRVTQHGIEEGKQDE